MSYPDVYPSKINYRPGRIQSLTAHQEILLKQVWGVLLKYCGYSIELSFADLQSEASLVASSVVARDKEVEPVKTKKKSFFSRGAVTDSKKTSDARAKQLKDNVFGKYVADLRPSENTWQVYSQLSGVDLLKGDDSSIESFVTASTHFTVEDQSQRDNKSVQTNRKSPAVRRNAPELEALGLARHDAQILHSSLFGSMKNDLIDNLILRFLRARKFSLPNSTKMLCNSLKWRHDENLNKIVNDGDAPAFVSGTEKGFVKNFTVNKAFLRGHDKNQNPMFFFQSRKHFSSDATLQETEKYALLIIEWCRLYLREVHESVDTSSLMFDLSGFSLKNADNGPIKFLASIFEAYYPESLGIVIVHNAPWIFSTVWNVIKKWLDPVVTSKIHFTKGHDELLEFLDDDQIPEYLGGKDKRPLVYPEPTKEHTHPIKEKDADYETYVQRVDEVRCRIIETTIKWIETTDPATSSKYLRDKIYLSYQLSDLYIAMDPYLRNPGIYDRDGTLKIRS